MWCQACFTELDFWVLVRLHRYVFRSWVFRCSVWVSLRRGFFVYGVRCDFGSWILGGWSSGL